MKITDLKLGDSVIFPIGFKYTFKGTEKRTEHLGKVECFVFWSDELKSEKLLHKHKVLSHNITVKEGNYHW